MAHNMNTEVLNSSPAWGLMGLRAQNATDPDMYSPAAIAAMVGAANAVIAVEAGGDIEAAINSLPATGGTIQLKIGAYTSPYQNTATSVTDVMSKANVTIIGAGAPEYNSDSTALVGGTIIKGSFFFGADNFSIERLGIDAGSAFCAAEKAGIAQEGLIAFDTEQIGGPAVPVWSGVRIRDVKVLCKGSNSDVHACLIENYDSGAIDDLETRLGGAGLVVKSSNLVVTNSLGRGHFKYSQLIKSEGYQAANFNTFINPRALSLAVELPTITNSSDYDTAGFVIQASSADAVGNRIYSASAIGCVSSVLVQALSTFQCIDNRFSGVHIRNCYDYPLRSTGVAAASVTGLRVYDLDAKNCGDGISLDAQTSAPIIVGSRVEGALNYSISTYAAGLRLIAFESKDAASGTGALRQLGGSTTYTALEANGQTRIATVAGTVRSSDGVLDKSGAGTWVEVDDTGHIKFAGAAVVNNAVQSSTFPTQRVGHGWMSPTTGLEYVVDFHNPNGRVGLISTSGLSTSYATTSDRRKKIDIGPADISDMSSVPVRRMAFKVAPTEEFISMYAQDVRRVAPWAVVESKDGTLNVDFSKLVPILWAKVFGQQPSAVDA